MISEYCRSLFEFAEDCLTLPKVVGICLCLSVFVALLAINQLFELQNFAFSTAMA